MKRLWKLGYFMLAAMLLLAGCSDGGEEKEEEAKEPAQELHVVSINGKEIRVGETKVQALLDDGFKITVSDMDENNNITQYEIDPEEELEAMSYYTGGSVWITESIFAHISIATEEAVPMGEAVIARLEFSMATAEPEELEGILLDGVPVSEIDREKAGEMFPDFEGDEVMWFQYGLDYDYFLAFGLEGGKMSQFTLEKKYDVDWLGEDE